MNRTVTTWDNSSSGWVAAAPDDGGLVITGEAARYEELMFPSWSFGAGMMLAEGSLRASIDAGPDVALLAEHRGWPLASTRAPGPTSRLQIFATDEGMTYVASLDRQQSDSVLAWQKVDAGLFAQASFGFYVVDGEWTTFEGEDVYRVTEACLNGGDVSIVRLGANPNTSSVAAEVEPVPIAANVGGYRRRLI